MGWVGRGVVVKNVMGVYSKDGRAEGEREWMGGRAGGHEENETKEMNVKVIDKR